MEGTIAKQEREETVAGGQARNLKTVQENCKQAKMTKLKSTKIESKQNDMRGSWINMKGVM
jgi:hypothetical protein